LNHKENALDQLTSKSKNGFPHFMLKEIYEQPEAVRRTLENCLDAAGNISFRNFAITPEEIRRLRKITVTASGSSRHSGLIGEFMLERMTGLPVEVDFASQYCYRDPVVAPNELTIFISQSGTTIDTIAALHEVSRKKSMSLTICNVPDTPLTRDADAALLTYAGDEVAIAATKSFTTQLTALFLLSAYMAEVRGTTQNIRSAVRALQRLPAEIERVLSVDKACRKLAQKFFRGKAFLYMGRDIDYPIALEGALKLKEVSYIHAEGYPTGELKHGPTALIDEQLPVVVLATRDESDRNSLVRYEKTVSNIREFVERRIPVLAVVTEGDTRIPEITPYVMAVPDMPVLLQPITEVVPLQLLAYHIGVMCGHSVDKPRNLSKSVLAE
jgi:glutamine---fructose-6-phosphate transaminase (isomerizing)